jgi:hypothetical protein
MSCVKKQTGNWDIKTAHDVGGILSADGDGAKDAVDGKWVQTSERRKKKPRARQWG